VSSLYFVVAALLGAGLLLAVRDGRKADWPADSAWRRFVVLIGWLFALVAVLLWAGLLILMIDALLTSMHPSAPKPASMIFFIAGGLYYLVLISIAKTAFRAARGSARSDSMDKIRRSSD